MKITKRYVVVQLLHCLTVMVEHIYHELWRVLNVEADGLTPSEWRQGERLLRDLRDWQNRMAELSNRIKTPPDPN